MKLKNIFFVSLFFMQCMFADDPNLAPKNYTDEKLLEIVRQEELAIERLAEMQRKIIQFCLSENCDQAAIDLIQPYLDNRLIWDCWFNYTNPEDPEIVIDVVNVIHLVIIYQKYQNLEFLCKELNKINNTNYFNIPTRMQNLLPIQLSAIFQCWNCLMYLIEYGADQSALVNPFSPGEEAHIGFENAVYAGRHFMFQKKIKTVKNNQRKKFKKIKKQEKKAFEKIKNFAYGIDSDSDYRD